MSRELINPLSMYTKNSGGGSFNYNGTDLILNNYIWVHDGEYHEISPTGNTYYYDIIFSNTSGSLFYIGFEKYDANKTATSNNSCYYILSSSAGYDHARIKGTVNLSQDSAGSPTKFIRIRILNSWNASNATTNIGKIHFFSLREASVITQPYIKQNGVWVSDKYREGNNCSLYKNGYVETPNFIEN